ncbi:MBL fold metallo-hydrolase [Salinithrix halophila]|uniref:MBL fold metallo-hydrolase n=1 Tax=Salinithrix halophila TaxID=1485204 RepID=A0ABV8JPL5_9BACL
MKWTVLGFQSPFPGPGGATPGYLLEADGKRILIDCGSGVLAQLGKYCRPHELNEVWLSHLHHDHVADFFVLQYALQTAIRLKERPHGLQVLAPPKPVKISHLLSYQKAVDLKWIGQGMVHQIGSLEVGFHRTDHPVPCYAMEIRSGKACILYGADAGTDTRWETMAREPDLFVCEGTYLHRDAPAQPIGHHSVREAAKAATELGARRLLLTHLYPGYPAEILRREAADHYTGELILAEIGLQIPINPL